MREFLVIRGDKIRPDADDSTAIDFQLYISCCQDFSGHFHPSGQNMQGSKHTINSKHGAIPLRKVITWLEETFPYYVFASRLCLHNISSTTEHNERICVLESAVNSLNNVKKKILTKQTLKTEKKKNADKQGAIQKNEETYKSKINTSHFHGGPGLNRDSKGCWASATSQIYCMCDLCCAESIIVNTHVMNSIFLLKYSMFTLHTECLMLFCTICKPACCC